MLGGVRKLGVKRSWRKRRNPKIWPSTWRSEPFVPLANDRGKWTISCLRIGTLNTWMESGGHLMEVTDHSASKMAVLPISECSDRLVHMPVSHNTDPQGDTCPTVTGTSPPGGDRSVSNTPGHSPSLSGAPNPYSTHRKTVDQIYFCGSRTQKGN